MDYPASQVSTSTVSQCPACRAAAGSSLVVARVRVASALVFVRQLQLEVEELAELLEDEPQDVES